jgi:hypothetical protein
MGQALAGPSPAQSAEIWSKACRMRCNSHHFSLHLRDFCICVLFDLFTGRLRINA